MNSNPTAETVPGNIDHRFRGIGVVAISKLLLLTGVPTVSLSNNKRLDSRLGNDFLIGHTRMVEVDWNVS